MTCDPSGRLHSSFISTCFVQYLGLIANSTFTSLCLYIHLSFVIFRSICVHAALQRYLMVMSQSCLAIMYTGLLLFLFAYPLYLTRPLIYTTITGTTSLGSLRPPEVEDVEIQPGRRSVGVQTSQTDYQSGMSA